MGPKEFQFLTINTKSLWEAGTQENLDITEDGLSLRGGFVHVLGEQFDASISNTPAAFAVDACGVLYILDAQNCSVRLHDPTDTGCSEWLPCIGGCGTAPGKFSNPQAIALSPSNLYIADTGNHRVQTFARINLQIRWVVGPLEDSEGTPLKDALDNPLTIDIKPIDLALDAQDNLYVLDAANQLVHQFDLGGRLLSTFAISLTNPTQLIVANGFLYVLSGDDNQVLKVNIQTHEQTPITLPEGFKPSGLAVDTEGNLYIGDNQEAEEEQFIYKFNSSGKQIGVVSGFLGETRGIQRDRKGNLYVLDGEGGITFLELMERFATEGSYTSNALDSGTVGLQWHKIVMDADIPENTQVTVSYYISDHKALPSNPAWSDALVNPKDALILSSQGRYLWLKIDLFGDEVVTPKIKNISAYFPRLSYLRYLPGIYQEDEASRDFLERFLSLFETFFFNLEGKIDSLTTYFDVNATPFEEGVPERDFLTWLSSWLAVAFDENWEEAKKREFLDAVPELYKKRGTREGLKTFIEIYTDIEPIIVEHFQLDCIKDEEIEQIWTTLFGASLYSFCVLLLPEQVETESQLNTVRRIVESEKPAHTKGGVKLLQPWIYLDMHTYLGINSMLSEPVFRLGETSVISRDTVLSDPEEGGQVERHARVGVDIILT